MNAAIIAILLQTLVHMAGPASVPEPLPTDRKSHSESHVYIADRNAPADVDRALADAKASGKTVLIVMGANWCHDSVGLAGWFETPRFASMLRDRYELVYVDVGVPQTGRGRNLDIAKRFGIRKVKGTPLVLVVSPDGKLLNSKKDAASWRNAASRSEDDIYRYFDRFTPA
jgi:Thioredoxin-like